MRRTSRPLGWVLLGLALCAVFEACSNSTSTRNDGPSNGFGGTSGSGMMDATTVDTPAEGGAGGLASDYDPACGVTAPSACVPDDPRACESFHPGAGSGGGAGRGGASGSAGSAGTGTGGASAAGFAGEFAGGEAGEAGAGGEGGQSNGGEGPTAEGGQSSSGTGGTAGLSSSGGSSGSSGSSGSGGTSGTAAPPDAGPTVYSCQVNVSGNEPRSVCALAGIGDADAPCLDGTDCKPGLACVGKVAGRCRPACCDHDRCGSVSGTHCSLEPLARSNAPSGDEPVLVPVCVVAIECSLAEDYPCTGSVCTCPESTACMVVGTDGNTSCVPPGIGAEGEACPCAWGHVCSQVTGRCVKLCQTAAPADDCGSGRCEASPALPLGWGLCVGRGAADAGQ